MLQSKDIKMMKDRMTDRLKTKFLTYVKLVLISDTYCILIFAIPLLSTAQKRDKLTLAPPCSELTLNSTIKCAREPD